MSEDYEENGYIVRRGLVPLDLVEQLNARFDEVADGRVEPAPNLQIARNVQIAKGLVKPSTRAHGIAKLNFVQGDPIFERFSVQEPLLDEVQKLVGDDLIALNSMYLNKPPNVDGRHPLHQDLLYFPFRPARNIVGVWTALQRVTRENGCLVVIPGSHKGELLDHDYPDWEHKNYLFVGVKGVDTEGRMHIEMEPGDTVFFHPLLIHGSGLNKTQGLRRAIAVHFVNAQSEDIWHGKTEFAKGVDPRLDYRLVRGEDPNGYVMQR